jgi:hypothetical protein
MPYDPNFPTANTLADADQMRAQLNGLNDKIDAIPGITGAVVDSVTTVGPGQPATVTVSVIGTILHLSLTIPEGQPGLQGLQGTPGSQGPPFANAVIDSVTMLNPGEPASVWVSFDGTNVHFVFNIPRGAQGEQGIQGPPGEVTNAAMASAISSAITDTARNPIGIAPFSGSFSDPPTQAEMQAHAAYVESLRAALVR